MPEGWITRGALPPFEVPLDEDDLFSLTEDILYLRHPTKPIALDVGWYPELDAGGGYRCLVIRNDEWHTPVEEFRARALSAVQEWLRSRKEQYW